MTNKTTLYKQMLKRLLIPAIILGSLSIVVSVMNMAAPPTPSIGINLPNSYRVFCRYYMGQPIAAAIAPALIAFMFIGPIVFTYVSFSYMNKRRSSDFYDSMPYSRLTGYTSRIGAILTYQYAIILVTMLVTVVTMLTAGVKFDFSYIPKLLFSFMAGSTLIVGGVALAMSITGTLISNLAMSFVILVLPRIILFTIDRIILQFTHQPFIDISSFGIFLNPVFNIPTALILDITGTWEYYGTSEILLHAGASAYCLVLGLIYIAITAFIMKKRKAELAERCAPCALAGHIYSALLVLPILVVAFYKLLDSCVFVTRPETLNTCIVFVVVAFVIFLTFEFMINRKLKSLVIAMPIFAVAVILAVGIIVGGRSLSLKINKYVPELDEIESIQLDENGEKSYRYKPLYSYSHLMTRNIVYKDSEIIQIFRDNLKETIENADKLRQSGAYNYRPNAGNVYCKINLKNGKVICRDINMYETDKKYSDLAKYFHEHEEYQMYSNAIPRLHEIDNLTLDTGYNHCNDIELAYETYNNLKYEYDKIDDKNKRLISNHYSRLQDRKYYSGQYESPSIHVGNMSVHGHIGDINFKSYYNINDFVPITSELCMKRLNEINGDKFKEKLLELKKLLKNDNARVYVSMNMVNCQQVSQSTLHLSNIHLRYDSDDVSGNNNMVSADEMVRILKIVEQVDIMDVDMTKPLLTMTIDFVSDTDYNNELYLTLDQEQAQKIVKIFEDKVALIGD